MGKTVEEIGRQRFRGRQRIRGRKRLRGRQREVETGLTVDRER